MHLPYDHHDSMDRDHALGLLEELHADFLKHCRKIRMPAKKYIWLGGGDFNCDVFQSNPRAYAIQTSLQKYGCCAIAPCHAELKTFRQWTQEECTHMIDGFIVSKSHYESLESHSHGFNICDAISYLTDTNHDPVEVVLDLEKYIRYEALDSSDSETVR